MSNITRDCHIIWQGYMKGFLKDGENLLPHYDFNSGKIELGKSTKGLGYEKDVFNYFDYIEGKRVDDLEKMLGNNEDNLTNKIRKISNSIQSQLKSKEKEKIHKIIFDEESKKIIINLIIFMDYKLCFHNIYKYFTDKKNTKKIDKSTQNQISRIVKNCSTEPSLNHVNKTLYDLIKSPRHWMRLYSDNDIFYFGDQPFHFRANINNGTNDGNNFQTFFSRKGSRLYFPITKNLALVIENPYELKQGISLESGIYITDNFIKRTDGIYKNDMINGEIPRESLSYVINYSIVQNCNRYIAGPDKNQLDIIRNTYQNESIKQFYFQDIPSYIYKNTLPKILNKYFNNSNLHFTITNSIVSKIEQIYRIWGVIENAHIVPERQQKLKQIARLRSGVYSTKIEGNRISYDEAERFLAGEKIKARPRDETELKNYMKVLDYIESKESAKTITEKDIFKIHQLTTKNILDSSHHNKRRNQANAIYNEGGGIVYLPPDWKDVPRLMSDLLYFINTQKDISVIIRAGLLHHWFVIIHPFIDGNGRTARALTQLFLYQNGFNTKKYFSLEEYYDSDLANYYEAIFIGNDFYSADKKKINSTKFVEYFLSGLEHELDHLKKTIESIKDDEQFENKLIVARLNNRQVHISAYIKEKLSVTAKELLTEYNVSLATIKRDLDLLVRNGIIKSVGFGKSTRYEPVLSGKGAKK